MRLVKVSKDGNKKENAQAARKKVSKEGYDRRGGGKMQRYMDKSIGHGGWLVLIQSGKDGTAV